MGNICTNINNIFGVFITHSFTNSNIVAKSSYISEQFGKRGHKSDTIVEYCTAKSSYITE